MHGCADLGGSYDRWQVLWEDWSGAGRRRRTVAAIGLTTVPRPANAGGIGPGAAVGIGLGAFALGSQTRTTITRIITRTATTATTRPPRRTIRLRRIIRPHAGVGAPITITITLVE